MSRFTISKTTVRGLLRAVACATAAVALAPSAAGAAPVIDRGFAAPTPNAEADPFYTPPAVIPDGQPGDVIRARPAKAGPPSARALGDAWQVMYRSTNAIGEPSVATGTIIVPKSGNRATMPIVGFAPGTTGPAFRCTVSRFINSGAFYEQPAVNDMLRAGYAVAVTDYEGYHENPKTTYIVGASMGAALLNVVRAASRLPDTSLSASSKAIVRGYSQGGGAAMWAGQMAPTYAPDINLVGVVGGGVPANLAIVAAQLQGKPAFGFVMASLIGLDNAYPELILDDFLTPVGREAITKLTTSDCTIELLLDYSGKRIADFTTSAPFAEPEWRDRIDPLNLLGRTKIEVPVFQYHADNDKIVAPSGAANLRADYCALGVDLQFKQFIGTGHITTVARGNADASAFLADRFAGKPSTPNCPAP